MLEWGQTSMPTWQREGILRRFQKSYPEDVDFAKYKRPNNFKSSTNGCKSFKVEKPPNFCKKSYHLSTPITILVSSFISLAARHDEE